MRFKHLLSHFQFLINSQNHLLKIIIESRSAVAAEQLKSEVAIYYFMEFMEFDGRNIISDDTFIAREAVFPCHFCMTIR